LALRPQTKTLGDPKRMRPAVRRTGFDYADPTGEYVLGDGRAVRAIWVPVSQTHDHIIVWFPNSDDPPEVVPYVARVNAAVETEKLLRAMES
jgi:hypothetical protein